MGSALSADGMRPATRNSAYFARQGQSIPMSRSRASQGRQCAIEQESEDDADGIGAEVAGIEPAAKNELANHRISEPIERRRVDQLAELYCETDHECRRGASTTSSARDSD